VDKVSHQRILTSSSKKASDRYKHESTEELLDDGGVQVMEVCEELDQVVGASQLMV
jgi:hypothetical protein